MTAAEALVLACNELIARDRLFRSDFETPGVDVQPPVRERMKVVRFFASYRGWQIDRVDDEGFQLTPSACAKPISLEAEIYSPGMIGDQDDHRCGAWLWLGRGGETWEMGLWGPWREVASSQAVTLPMLPMEEP